MPVHHIIIRMNKRFTTAFTVFSFLVFTFLIVWFVFRTINIRSGNLLSAKEELDQLSQTVSSSYLAGGSFGSPYFAEKVRKKIDEMDSLKALVVTTDPGQIEYVFATSRDYLPPKTDFEKPIGVPVAFSFNTVTEENLTTASIMPSEGDIRLDAVFGILGRREVFPIVRELLIGLLSFLLITAVLIILYPFLSAKAAKAAGALDVREEPGSPPVEPMISPVQKEVDADAESAVTAATGPPFEPMAVAEDEDEAQPAEPIVHNRPETNKETAGLYSPATELGWEHYLEERLSAELKRAASFDQDLVLLLGCVNGLKNTDPFYADLAQMAREFFNFQDLCFEYGRGGIGIIIPNVDIDQGIERVEGFKNRVDLRLKEAGGQRQFSLGLSARNGRLISGNRIIREAKSALRRATRESGGITAFRVDPEKYRNFISSNKISI